MTPDPSPQTRPLLRSRQGSPLAIVSDNSNDFDMMFSVTPRPPTKTSVQTLGGFWPASLSLALFPAAPSAPSERHLRDHEPRVSKLLLTCFKWILIVCQQDVADVAESLKDLTPPEQGFRRPTGLLGFVCLMHFPLL